MAFSIGFQNQMAWIGEFAVPRSKGIDHERELGDVGLIAGVGERHSVRELLEQLGSIQETVMIFPSAGGRPKARRMLTEKSRHMPGLLRPLISHSGPRRKVRSYISGP